jgi:hypothetical protein
LKDDPDDLSGYIDLDKRPNTLLADETILDFFWGVGEGPSGSIMPAPTSLGIRDPYAAPFNQLSTGVALGSQGAIVFNKASAGSLSPPGETVAGSPDRFAFSILNVYYYMQLTPGNKTLRGYKYGLMGVRQTKSDAVFRRDRFGQFRDMLEQRLYGRFFGPMRRFGRVASSVKESAISIRFVDEDGNLTTAANTKSQNLSRFSTSSMPYYDDMITERTDDPYADEAFVTVT